MNSHIFGQDTFAYILDTSSLHSIETVLLPIAYFGPVKYYRLRLQYPHLIEIHENYQKRSIRNRCTILAANGPHKLSIPLQKGKTQTKITEVKISYEEDWVTQHLMTIKSAYSAAPYYEYYKDKVEDLLKARPALLYDLLLSIDTFVRSQLSDLAYSTTSRYLPHYDIPTLDFRNIKITSTKGFTPYNQVFEYRHGFVENLSILDMLFNLGRETESILKL